MTYISAGGERKGTVVSNEISNYEDLTDLAEMMAEIKRQMQEIQEQNSNLETQVKEFTTQEEEAYAEYQTRVENIRSRKKAVDDLLWDSRQTLKRLNKNLQEVDRQHTQAMMVRKAEEEFAETVKTWDEITADAPWRELAKQFQLEGAQKIAYSRSTILADVMGLGKTLQAIMALDYLMAAQPEATVENIHRKGYHRYNPDNINADCGICTDIAAKPEPSYGDLHYDHYGEYYEQKEVPAAGKKILYVAPVSLIRNVEREFAKWAPYREKPIVLTGYSKTQRRMALSVVRELEKAVVLVNYEAWRKDLALIDDLLDVGFDTIVIDEAHNIKDRATIAYRGIRWLIDGQRLDLQKNVVHKGEPIHNVIPMTGSPILNRPQELYTLLTLVDKLQFPPTTQGENAFLRDFCYQDKETYRWYFRSGGLENLARKISNRFIRRTRDDAGIELPPQEIVIHALEIDEELYPNQAAVRKEMRDKAMILLDPERGVALVAKVMLSVYLRLRQIETWPAGIKLKDEDGVVIMDVDVKESQKIDYVIHPNGSGEYGGLLPEICPEERTVIFSQFKEPLREIHRRATAAGIRAVILDGETPRQVRDTIAADFDRTVTAKHDAKYDLVLANYKVGGLGLNLTGATQTIILDEEWNPGKRDQAYDRTNRMGQTEETAVHVIRMQGTVDSWLAQIISDKEEIVGGFNQQMSGTAFFEALRDGEI